jgi:RNA polymerase sigma-70 factor (ECF subfamily)
MDFASLDDETLIRYILHARPEALSALYDRYVRLVFSLALHMLGDAATAEEVTQDVFYRVWEKSATYRPEQAKVATWLTSITRYRAIDILRQRGVRAEQHSIGWEDLSPGFDPPAPDDPAEGAALHIQAQQVRAAVATLPPDQRIALALAFFQGLSHTEIAQHLGEPLGTVKTRIRLGMLKLRDVLKEMQVEG